MLRRILKRWKITSGTRGSPVDDAFCIFLWNSSIKELCCVVRRARCCAISCVVLCATREVLCNKLCGATCSVELCARRDAVGSQYEVT